MLKKLKKVLIFVLIIPFMFLIGCGKDKKNDNSNNQPPAVTEPKDPDKEGGSNPEEPEEPEVPTEKYFNVEVDYKLPAAYTVLLPKVSARLKVGESYTLPAISDTKLNEYFDGYYIKVGETEQKLTEKYSGAADEDAKIYAKWKSEFETYLKTEYYTDGVEFNTDGESASVSGYSGTSEIVVIPKTYLEKDVVVFASECFKDNQNVKEIILPANIFRAEESAFENSTLEKIDFSAFEYIGNSAFKNTKVSNFAPAARLTYLGSSAFSGCSELSEIDLSQLSSDITVLQNELFMDCISLTSIEFSAAPTITRIGEYTFSGCVKLEEFNLKSLSGLTQIDSFAFESSGLKSVSMPSTLESMGASVFDQSQVEEIELEKLFCDTSLNYDFVTYFGTLPNLLNVTLTGNTITEIPEKYFANQTFETFVMNDALSKIGSNAFMGCTNLLSITFSESLSGEDFDVSAFSDTRWINETTGPLILGGGTTLCFVPQTIENLDLNNYETVTVIAKNAFYQSKTIKNVVISSEITKICEKAFYNCTNLNSIQFADSTENVLQTIEKSAFEKCSSLESINLEKCTALSSISDYAFMNCTSLSGLRLPSSLQTIGSGSFAYMSCIITVDDESQNFVCEDNVLYKLEEGEKTVLLYYPSSLQSRAFVLPDTVTSVSSYAFCLCTDLQYLYVKNAVTFNSNFAMKCSIVVLSEVAENTAPNIIYLLDSENYGATNQEGQINITITAEELDYSTYFVKVSDENGSNHIYIITIESETNEVTDINDITEILNFNED